MPNTQRNKNSIEFTKPPKKVCYPADVSMPAYTGYDFRLKLGSNFCFRRMKKTQQITMLIEEIFNVSIGPIWAGQKFHGEEKGNWEARRTISGGQQEGRQCSDTEAGTLVSIGTTHLQSPATGHWHHPYMINSAATYNTCCTVYMTYFKTEETQHPCSSYVLPPLKHLSFGPHCGRAPGQNYDRYNMHEFQLNPISHFFWNQC